MTTDTVGGVWNYSLELIRALGAHGVEVTLLAMGRSPSDDQARAAARLPNLRLVATDLKLEWMPEPEADLAEAARLLAALAADVQPDIVHINGFACATADFSAPVIVVAHSCVATWWQACRGGPLPREWNRYRARIAAGIGAADTLVAPTRTLLDGFVALHGAPARTAVIHNGVDPARYRPGDKRPQTMAAGRLWDAAKNLDLLREAGPRLTHPLRIAGEGPAGALSPNLRLLGRLDGATIAAEMACAAVFVAPARYEPFGLAILEAALSGCALVLGDIPTLRELWDGAAVFVDPGDAAALASAVNGLTGAPHVAAAAGASARSRGLRYNAEAMATGYFQLYADAIARQALRSRRGAVAA
jgi:glycosyltransferase involved in cell wall biosynthesis